MENKQKIIEGLYKTNSYFDNPRQALNQVNLLETISGDMYSDPKRFILEIIQNADDSSNDYGSKSLNLNFNFIEKDNCLIISHNGRPIDEKDINALCSAGNSVKSSNKETTGYKGIGFKSVFLHSKKVFIVSNSFQFKFDKDYFLGEKGWYNNWEDRKNFSNLIGNSNLPDVIIPWQICPIWSVNELPTEVNNFIKRFRVNFIIYFKRPDSFKLIKKVLNEIYDNHLYFIFLKSVILEVTILEDFKIKYNIVKENNHPFVSFKDSVQNNSEYLGHYFIYDKEFLTDELNEEKKNTYIEDYRIPKKLFTHNNKIEVKISFAAKLNKIDNRYIVDEFEKDKRVIYNFLPTKQNYNFPFLINSCFVVDASRTNLKTDCELNLFIFEKLPESIFSFYQKLFEDCGNSYALMAHKPEISNIDLNEIFYKYTNLIENESDKGFLFMTNANIHYYLNESYIYEDNTIRLEDFFDKIMMNKGMDIAKNLVEKYLDIEYEKCNEINTKDRKYIDIIRNNYRNNNFKLITNDLILKFIELDLYFNADDKVIVEYVILLREIFSIETLRALTILPDNDNIFRVPGQLKTKSNIYLEYYDINGNYEKYFLKREIHSHFVNKNKLSVLMDLGVEIAENKNIDSVIKDLLISYKKENSIKIVQDIFKLYHENHEQGNHIINEMKKKNYLLKNGEFIPSQCICIGNFYSNDYCFENLTDNILSEDYYLENSNKEMWFEFFKKLDMWNNIEEMRKIQIGSEFSKYTPFVSKKYKDLIIKESKKKKNIYIILHPQAESIFHYKDDDYIINFIKKNFDIINQTSIKNKFTIFNYIIYNMIESNKIISNKNDIKDFDSIYSYSITSNKEKVVENVYDKVLRFPYNKELFNLIKSNLDDNDDDLFKIELSNYDVICLLFQLKKEIESKRSGTDDFKKLKDEYKYLLVNYTNKYLEYSGPLIDENEELKESKKLYYFEDELTKVMLEQYFLKNYDRLYIPSDTHNKINYMEFCKYKKVTIINKNMIKLKFGSIKEEITEIKEEISNFIESIKGYEKKILGTEFKNIIDKLSSIKFYSCNNINVSVSEYNLIKDVISTYNETKKINYIYFIKNETYSSWKHNTILYYITRWINEITGNYKIGLKIRTFFTRDSVHDYKEWLLDSY